VDDDVDDAVDVDPPVVAAGVETDDVAWAPSAAANTFVSAAGDATAIPDVGVEVTCGYSTSANWICITIDCASACNPCGSITDYSIREIEVAGEKLPVKISMKNPASTTATPVSTT